MKKILSLAVLACMSVACNSKLSSDEELMLKLKMYGKDIKKGDVVGECLTRYVDVKAESREGNIVTAAVKMKEAYGMIAMLGAADTITKQGCDAFDKMAEKEVPKADLETVKSYLVTYDVQSEKITSQKKQ